MTAYEFQAQYLKSKNVFFSFALKLTKDREDAEDLVQETLFKALRNKHRFMQGTNFKAWMLTIMKNLFINDYRKKSRMRMVFDGTDSNYHLEANSPHVRNGAVPGMLMEELTGIIERVPDELRHPFVMYYHGYKYKEIANHLNIPLGTVKSKIHAARTQIKKGIKSRYPNIRHRSEMVETA
ncbi:MAG: RNA polymerase sigma factor [Bacteroidota bacterium]